MHPPSAQTNSKLFDGLAHKASRQHTLIAALHCLISSCCELLSLRAVKDPMKQPPRALLKFSAILEASTHGSLPYPALKRLLRYLKAVHPAYPRRLHVSDAPPIWSLSQTQNDETENDNLCSLSVDKNGTDGNKAKDSSNENSLPPPQAEKEFRVLSQDTEETLSLKCCLSPVQSTEGSVAVIEAVEAGKENDANFCNVSTRYSSQARKRMRLEDCEPHDQMHQGIVINEALLELAHDKYDGIITWGQLRQRIATISEEFEMFCERMDEMFERHDVVAKTDLGAPCVLYSREFWEAAWNGFCNVNGRRKSYKSVGC